MSSLRYYQHHREERLSYQKEYYLKHRALKGRYIKKPKSLPSGEEAEKYRFLLIGLWLGEGEKYSYMRGGKKWLGHIGISNSDIKILKFAVKAFEKGFDIRPEELRARAIIGYKSSLEEVLKISKEIGVPIQNFTKTLISPTRSFAQTVRIRYYGVWLVKEFRHIIESRLLKNA